MSGPGPTNVYSFGVRIDATLYVKADTEEQARTLAEKSIRTGIAIEVRTDGVDDLPISGAAYDSPLLPVVSLSPAMSLNRQALGAADLAHEVGSDEPTKGAVS